MGGQRRFDVSSAILRQNPTRNCDVAHLRLWRADSETGSESALMQGVARDDWR